MGTWHETLRGTVSLYDYEIDQDGSAQYMVFQYLGGGEALQQMVPSSPPRSVMRRSANATLPFRPVADRAQDVVAAA
jgi:hypothetical protein